jgi:hypothetical protein
MNYFLTSLRCVAVVVLFASASWALTADTGTARGSVTRFGSSTPVAGARVVIDSATVSSYTASATTAGDGTFSFMDTPLGEFVVKVYDSGQDLLVSGSGSLNVAGQVVTMTLSVPLSASHERRYLPAARHAPRPPPAPDGPSVTLSAGWCPRNAYPSFAIFHSDRYRSDDPFAYEINVLRLGLTARGKSLAAFDGRCILAGCVALPSNIPDILGHRAWPARRLARLGATPDFHHGLLSTAQEFRAGPRPARKLRRGSPKLAQAARNFITPRRRSVCRRCSCRQSSRREYLF